MDAGTIIFVVVIITVFCLGFPLAMWKMNGNSDDSQETESAKSSIQEEATEDIKPKRKTKLTIFGIPIKKK
jgi:hypothetical protein